MPRAWEQKEALLEQQHNQLEQGLEDLIAGGSEPSHLPQMMHLIQKLKLHLRLEERWLSEASCLCQGHRLSHQELLGSIEQQLPQCLNHGGLRLNLLMDVQQWFYQHRHGADAIAYARAKATQLVKQ